jgi:virginiamycin B lyase
MAQSPTITEFQVPSSENTQTNLPNSITMGADGALWFPAFAVGGEIGKITTGGSASVFGPLGGGASFSSGDITAGPDGALWVAGAGGGGGAPAFSAGRITTAGAFTEFVVPSANETVSRGIAAGPDGALWVADTDAPAISRIDPIAATGGTSQGVTTFPLTNGNSAPFGITAGPDGAIWFTENAVGRIGRITTSGTITEFPINAPTSTPARITTGPDGNLWFADLSGFIGRMTTSGTLTKFPVPGSFPQPLSVAVGSDGAIWFTESGGQKIGRVTMSGVVSDFSTPTTASMPAGITAGPDGALWFTESSGLTPGKIGRAVPAAILAPPLVAAVLPASRSIPVGSTATAFATIINTTTSAVSGCSIVPTTTVPTSFVYQTTNPQTNAITGSPNTPVSLAAGGSQSFVIAFTANAPVVPTNVMIGFDCSNTDAAPINLGLNTLLLSASSTPTPDIVALAATSKNDGIVHVTGSPNQGAFAVATVNLGSSATITATANTGTATLPLTISLCQTNPSTGQCISPVSSSATTTIAVNATPTFAIFVAANGPVPFDPANARINVQFADNNNVVRGETSVAVETQ